MGCEFGGDERRSQGLRGRDGRKGDAACRESVLLQLIECYKCCIHQGIVHNRVTKLRLTNVVAAFFSGYFSRFKQHFLLPLTAEGSSSTHTRHHGVARHGFLRGSPAYLKMLIPSLFSDPSSVSNLAIKFFF